MEGYTAFFKHPLTITGTQVSLPCPPYSTILGLLSACAGRVVTYRDTRIGYEFRCSSTEVELERTERLSMEGDELKRHREGQGILKRYVHFLPHLDLYLTNLEFGNALKNPASTPCLGRSQDMMWITTVEHVELVPVDSGNIGPTMIPAIKENIPSLIVQCPDWFDNSLAGRTRIAGPFRRYQAMIPTSESRYAVSMANLYHPSHLANPDDVIYLHEWIEA
jgi:CRISPR-associated protein Cas5t